MNITTVSLFVLAGTFLSANTARAQTTSLNSGSLGAAGNGTNTAGVVVGPPGAVSAGGDFAAYYSGGSQVVPVNTTVPFNLALNPISTAPFTIEFWANPATDVTDGSGPAPVFNRVTAGNRSGWVFFQRSAAQGWNFAMYNGNASQVGLQLTGGTYTPGAWSHVVAVWNGTTPSLFVNGTNTNAPLVVGGAGGYNSSNAAIFSVGSYDTGANPFTGAVDETAFYNTALTAPQILAHFNAASSAVPGVYSSLIMSDGAVEYLRNIPEPSAASLIAPALIACSVMRQRQRQRMQRS